MPKTILITGATDGIGLETAKTFIKLGHTILLHGRNEKKLNAIQNTLNQINDQAHTETYVADLSDLKAVNDLAQQILSSHQNLDVLINNAGVFKVSNPVTPTGMDVRYVVNTIAPYLLTQQLRPLMGTSARVINLSSAAQAPLNPNELGQTTTESDNTVYAKSKLALTMWSVHLGQQFQGQGPVVVAVNPASFLGSKMVSEAYGVPGKSLQIGADVLVRAALSAEFAESGGRYFDNDSGQFAAPHPDATITSKNQAITRAIEAIITDLN